MTLVELIIGLAVTTMVMGALSAFSMAVSTAWREQEKSSVMLNSSSNAVTRIQQVLRDAKYLGAVRRGTLTPASNPLPNTLAALIFWKSDDGDGIMQLGELAVLEHDGTEVKLYEAPATNLLSGVQLTQALLPIPSVDLQALSAITDLQSWAIFQDPKTIVTHVAGAEFQVVPGTATERPTFKFTVKFDRDGEMTIRTAAASLRSALTASN